MSSKKPKPKELDLRTATGDEINEAMKWGVVAALRRHKEAGVPIVVWKNGEIVHILPEEIQIPEGYEDDTDTASSAKP